MGRGQRGGEGTAKRRMAWCVRVRSQHQQHHSVSITIVTRHHREQRIAVDETESRTHTSTGPFAPPIAQTARVLGGGGVGRACSHDGAAVCLVEAAPRAEEAWHQELEKRPQLGRAVLQGADRSCAKKRMVLESPWASRGPVYKGARAGASDLDGRSCQDEAV